MQKKIKRDLIMDILFLLVGSFVYSIAYDMFLVPGSIFVGGVGGIATIIHLETGISTGTMILIFNIPLLAGFAIMYGFKASIKSIISIVVASGFVNVFEDIFKPAFGDVVPENKLLYALFGGVVLGCAIGIMFSRGFTTGGTDIIALLLKPKFKKFSTSNLILITDIVVIAVATIYNFKEDGMLTALYSCVAVLMSTNMISIVTGGFDKGGIVFIFSQKYSEIADTIANTMQRGVTLLDGTGWYTKNAEKVILCVVKKNEVYQLKTLAKAIDPQSFIIMSESTETLGNGFKENSGEHGFEKKESDKAPKNA